jgi:hypothetical protein
VTAVLATFVNAKPVPTRSVLQLVFEVKIEEADAAMKALGGYPLPAESRWVGIALSPAERKGEAKKEKRAWDQLTPTEQAGIRCEEDEFYRFLIKDFPKGCAPLPAPDLVRAYCGVDSRAEFLSDTRAANKWRELESRYQQYLTDKRYESSRTR